ncbi:MAG: glycosyltransferase family 4 protein [Planctomycetaceae bacterium]
MHIAIVTAGGAGMFCGSCMHDNTCAKALRAAGADVTLIPTYTPIRLDEEDQSRAPVFLGGINVYLDHVLPGWKRIPRPLVRWLDAGWIIDLATKFGVSNDAHRLGALTLAMLDGEAGPQRREIDELVHFLANDLKPDVVCFSNALLVGVLRRLKERFPGRVFCTLQGDDVFLEALPEPYRGKAIAAIAERAAEFDGFLVHSDYYRDFMARYLSLPPEKFRRIPLGIDLSGHVGQPGERNQNPFTVGYFARVCPEKGLAELVEAFRILHAKHPRTKLRAGGYLSKQERPYFEKVRQRAADLGDAFEYIGSPATHAEKVAFYRSLDVLSVPTVYHEPKGLYVLEALANGVPVVQPAHGAFPELLSATGGGLLCEPGNAGDLAAKLEELYLDRDRRISLGSAGHAAVHSRFDPQTMAVETLEAFASSHARDESRWNVQDVPRAEH